MPTTRSEAEKQKKAAAKEGLDPNKIFPEGSKRRTQPPDRPGAAPQVYKDRNGNPGLLPGDSAITKQKIKLSGDSGKDIKELVDRTGQGGSGSGQTWHHHLDYDPETDQGTVTLMPTSVHQQHYHIGGSAQKRATDHGGDPDKLAKYGY
ncbi:MAG: HNH endonuclease [Nostoc sp.]